MEKIRDISWFKDQIAPILDGYEIEYRFFKEGDFGSLNQVIFNSSNKGGEVDFWGLGWLGIQIYDYKKDEQLLNVLLEPNEEFEQEKAFEDMHRILA